MHLYSPNTRCIFNNVIYSNTKPPPKRGKYEYSSESEGTQSAGVSESESEEELSPEEPAQPKKAPAPKKRPAPKRKSNAVEDSGDEEGAQKRSRRSVQRPKMLDDYEGNNDGDDDDGSAESLSSSSSEADDDNDTDFEEPLRPSRRSAPKESSTKKKKNSKKPSNRTASRRSTNDDDEAKLTNGYRTSAAARRSRRMDDDNDNLLLDTVSCYDLLADMAKHEDVWPFDRPVNKFDVPDYYKVIQRPMDLAKVKSKLNLGEYSTNYDFMNDIQLVFTNCDLYNNSGSSIYK